MSFNKQEADALLSELESEINPEPQAEEQKAEESKPEPKTEVKPDPKPSEEPKKEDPKAEPRKRGEVIPFQKFNETRKELQAEKEARRQLEERLKALEQSKTEPKEEPKDEGIEEIATKHGISAEVVADIAKLSERQFERKYGKTLEEVTGKVKSYDAERQAREESAAKENDEILYRKDEETVISKFPELNAYRSDLKKLAYADGNESVPLEYIALKLKSDLNLGEKPASSESATSAPSGKAKDFDNLTEEEFANLSDAELDKFMKRHKRR
jgi:hypothetical protein